jgi:hypothetical protein
MSRSTYIYVVKSDSFIKGAWTVKREMLWYIENKLLGDSFAEGCYYVVRLKDDDPDYGEFNLGYIKEFWEKEQ